MSRFASLLKGKSSNNYDTATLRTTPWSWRDVDGAYVGWNGEVWLYRALPVYPLTWEDPSTRLERGSALHNLLVELSGTGRDIAGINQLSRKRNIHAVSLTWDDFPKLPENITKAQHDYLASTLQFKTPHRALVVGVQLFPSTFTAVAKKKSRGASWREALGQITTNVLGEGIPDMTTFEEDRRVISEIFRRVGATPPEGEVLRQLESWYNSGKGPDCELMEKKDAIIRRTGMGTDTFIELSAVMSFNNSTLQSPHDQWLLDALSHENPASVVSVRAFLEPARNARERIRRNQRKLLSQESEVNATGDLSRIEDEMVFDLAQRTENYFATSGEPLVSATSIVMARISPDFPDDTYIDYLRSRFDIEVKPLEHRQMAALEETLPCSRNRVNPFLQEVSVGMLSYAGMHAHSRLGDETGSIYLGLCDPDGTPVMIDPLGAPKANLPPAMFLFGDPGSGKASWVEAKVCTPTGWVRMGDIKGGDVVTGSDGLSQRVLGVFPQGVQPLFKVSFRDGGSTTVTGDHLWTVSTTASSSPPSQMTVSTHQLTELLEDGTEVCVPTVKAVQYLTTSPQVNPAHFAAEWLGNPDIHLTESHLTAPLSWRWHFLRHALGDRDHLTEIPASKVAHLQELLWSVGSTAKLTPGNSSGILVPEGWSPHRIVASVEAAGSGYAQCIKVSNTDSLYVTDDYICTHNTFALQSMATQSALLGNQTIFINPKGFDTLAPFAEAVGGSVVKMSSIEGQQGFFDPFRYAPSPAMAAEIANEYILSVIGEGLTQNQRAMIGSTLKRAANAGAKCVGQALSMITDDQVKTLILNQMEASATFSLGIGMQPQEPLGLTGGLTLIEFDRKLDLPEKGIDPKSFRDSQRISLAAIRLVSRASLEMLNRSGGGVFILDEAWTVLGSSEGLAILQQLGREGRSLNILPIFATQRVADLLREGVDMQSYMTRVLAMKLDDDKEASAALQLCGLEPTPERIAWLHDCGPKRFNDGTSRAAFGLHRDLEKRHAALMVGPVPPAYYEAFTTNPEERRARENQE